MDPEAACARMVFILAEVTRVLDVEAVARRAAVERRQLVLLVVGRRVSAEQKMLVERALRSAGEHHLWFDAVWVTGASRAAEYIEEGDEVTILASGRERRRLERATLRTLALGQSCYRSEAGCRDLGGWTVTDGR